MIVPKRPLLNQTSVMRGRFSIGNMDASRHGRNGPRSAGHHDRRSYANALKKVHHILIVHANAAI